MRDAAICLAAGPTQVPVIEQIKVRGIDVIAVDRNVRAPGMAMVDVALSLSTWDAEPILHELQGLKTKYRVMAVVNRSSGPPVVTAARLSKAFGLPFLDPEIAEILIDKGQLGAFCKASGLPVADSCILNPDDPIPTDFSGPVVVKPCLSLVGKSGVRRIDQLGFMKEAVREARDAAIGGRVLLESFLPGRNLALIAYVHQGQVQPLALLEELNRCDANGQISAGGFMFPSCFEGQKEHVAICELAQELVNLTGMKIGTLNLSCRCVANGDPVIVEVHLDIGGDYILDQLLPAVTESDMLGELIGAILSGRSLSIPVFKNAAAVLFPRDDGPVNRGGCKLLVASDSRALRHMMMETFDG